MARLTDVEVARVKALATADLYFAEDTPTAYPRPLDERLARWYVYTSDGGHSLLVLTLDVLGSHAVDAAVGSASTAEAMAEATVTDLAALLVPAPVRAVLRSHWFEGPDDGFIRCDLPYDPALGLITLSDDEEFAR